MSRVTRARVPFIVGVALLALALPAYAVLAHTAASRAAPHSSSLTAGPDTYAVTDLGTLGGPVSLALAVNNLGQVVGGSLTPDFAFHAFLWRNGSMTDLGTLGGTFSQANGINARGQVVGLSTLAGDQVTHAFLWQNGQMTDLGTLGGGESEAWWINDAGQIAGDATTTSGLDHAFLWRAGQMTDLGTLGGESSVAFGINERGQLFGGAAQPGAPFCGSGVFTGCHAFVDGGGHMTDLGTLGGSWSLANPSNNRGQVIGFSALAGDAHQHAFLWRGGVMTDLPVVAGDTDATGNGINDAGLAVGSSGTAATPVHATLWRNGAVTDLNTVIPAGSGLQLIWAFGINEACQIAGMAATTTGETHAFLLTPGAGGTAAAAATARGSTSLAAARATQALGSLPGGVRHRLLARWTPRAAGR